MEMDEKVLSDINIDIKQGEVIGIVGNYRKFQIQCLVNLICRLYDVTDGYVKVGDKDVREYDLDILRNEVAVVLQKNQLFSGTILENLRWGNENASLEECMQACKLAQLMNLSNDFLKSMILMLNKVEQIYPADKNNDCVLQEPF